MYIRCGFFYDYQEPFLQELVSAVNEKDIYFGMHLKKLKKTKNTLYYYITHKKVKLKGFVVNHNTFIKYTFTRF